MHELQDHEHIGRESDVLFVELLLLHKPNHNINFLVDEPANEISAQFLDIPELINAIVGILALSGEEYQVVEVVNINHIDYDAILVNFASVDALGVQRIYSFVRHHHIPLICK